MTTVDPQTQVDYRADIDGLRALAIIPVVLFHYRLGHAPGGFVGVDIFFVISGYLISSLLLRDIERNRFSVLRFYERRARRILPALFFMLALVGCAAVFVLLPIDLANFGKSLLATTAFVSNFYFWTQANYFARAAEFKALLHTWSLAVEEQFYILFPICLYAIARICRSHLAKVLVITTAASLAASVWLSQTHPSVAFFWPVTRTWELLLGAFMAVGPVWKVQRRSVRDLMSIVGLLMIVTAISLINPSWPFPGWIALLPCLGAALIIYVGLCGGGIANSWLAAKPFVFMGLISYSLYLWHWPLIVLAQNVAPYGLSFPQRFMILTLALGMATLSWWYVERPFRGGNSRFDRRQVFALATASSIAAAVAGLGFWLGDGLPGRFPAFASMAREAGLEDSIFPECFSRTPEQVGNAQLCVIGADSPAPPSFIIWGDSHAQRLARPIAKLAAAHERRGWLRSSGSCPPLLGVDWPAANCRAFNDAVVRLIDAQGASVRDVIIAGLWAEYAEGSQYREGEAFGFLTVLSDDSSQGNSVDGNRRTFARALLRTVNHFTREGKRVVIVGPVPEIGLPVPETLFKVARFGGNKQFGPSRHEFESRQKAVLDALADAARVPGVVVVYPSDLLCNDTCAVARSEIPLYIDDNHLSRSGLELMEPLLSEVFDH